MDAESDDLDEPTVPPGLIGGLNASHILEDEGTDAPMALASPPRGTQPLTTDDIFGGSLSTLTASPQPHSVAIFDASRSATPELGVIKRHKKRGVAIDSDDDLADSSFGSPMKMPHPINTPRLRSSPTPPTSDTDQSAAKSQGKGKGKALMKGHAPPLVFTDDPERNSETPHAKKVLQGFKRKGKESHPKIKVSMICF